MFRGPLLSVPDSSVSHARHMTHAGCSAGVLASWCFECRMEKPAELPRRAGSPPHGFSTWMDVLRNAASGEALPWLTMISPPRRLRPRAASRRASIFIAGLITKLEIGLRIAQCVPRFLGLLSESVESLDRVIRAHVLGNDIVTTIKWILIEMAVS